MSHFYQVYSSTEKELMKESQDLASSAFLQGAHVQFSNEALGNAANLFQVNEPESNINQRAPDGWLTGRVSTRNEFVVLEFERRFTLSGFCLNTRGIHPSDIPSAFYLEARVAEEWIMLVQQAQLKPDAEIFFQNRLEREFYNAVRLTLVPNGGIGRLRLYGTMEVPPIIPGNLDIQKVANPILGGRVIESTVTKFDTGKASNILLQGEEKVDHGWLLPGNREEEAYVIIKLARPAIIAFVSLCCSNMLENRPAAFKIYGKLDQDWILLAKGLDPVSPAFHELYTRNMLFDKIKVVVYPGFGLTRVRVFGWFCEYAREMDPVQIARLNQYIREFKLAQSDLHKINDPIHQDADVDSDAHSQAGSYDYDAEAEAHSPIEEKFLFYFHVSSLLHQNNISFNTKALLRLIYTSVALGDVTSQRLGQVLASIFNEFWDQQRARNYLDTFPDKMFRDSHHIIYVQDLSEQQREYLRNVVKAIEAPLGGTLYAIFLLPLLMRTLNPTNNENPIKLPERLGDIIVNDSLLAYPVAFYKEIRKKEYTENQAFKEATLSLQNPTPNLSWSPQDIEFFLESQ